MNNEQTLEKIKLTNKIIDLKKNPKGSDFLNEHYIEIPETATDLFAQMLKDRTTFGNNTDILDVAIAYTRASDLQEEYGGELIDIENAKEPYVLNVWDLKDLLIEMKEYVEED